MFVLAISRACEESVIGSDEAANAADDSAADDGEMNGGVGAATGSNRTRFGDWLFVAGIVMDVG